MNTTELAHRVSAVLIKLRMNHPNRLTQKEVEIGADLTSQTCNNLESGTKRFNIKDLFKIAKFYNKRPSAMIALIEQSPEELSQVKQLQLTIDQLLFENERLKVQLAEQKGILA